MSYSLTSLKGVIWVFPAKPWSTKHVWIGLCFGVWFEVCFGVCFVVLGS